MVKNTENIIKQKISQLWPEHESHEILKILDQYGAESYHKEIKRVHLAIIKLSEGDLGRLKHFVDVARSDYRDVLAFAEYPGEMKLGFLGKKELTPEEVHELRKRDREQYLDWLENGDDD